MKTPFYGAALATLIFFGLSAPVHAQKFSWARNSGIASAVASKTIFDAKGNNYTAGSFQWINGRIGSFTMNDWGLFVVKTDKHGTIKWVKFGPGSFDVNAVGLAVDSKENTYVSGVFSYTMDLGDTVLNAGSEGSMFLVKYDSSGNFQWAKTPHKTASTFFSGYVAVDRNDNIYLSGQYIFNVILGNNVTAIGSHNTHYPSTDMFVAKFDQNGSAQWAVSISSSEDDENRGLKIGSDQNIYVIGKTSTTDVVINGISYQNDKGPSFLMRCDSNGQNIKFLPIEADVTDFSVLDSREIVLTGIGNNPGLGTTDYTGNFVTKLSPDWTLEWTKHIDAATAWSSAVATLGSDIYVGCNFGINLAADTIHFSTISGVTDIALLKLNETGYAQWGKQLSDGAASYVYSLDAINKNQIAISGAFATSGGTRVLNLDGITLINDTGNSSSAFWGVLNDSLPSRCPRPSGLQVVGTPNFCIGGATSLKASVQDVAVSWFKDNSFVRSDSASKAYPVSAPGNYFYVLFHGSMCADSSNLVSINAIDFPDTLVSVAPGVIICSDQPATLQVNENSGYAYQWFKDGNLMIGETKHALVAAVPGNYYCSITNAQTCLRKTNTHAIKSIPPQIDFLPDTLDQCKDGGITLTPANLSSQAWQYDWSDGSSAKTMSTNQEGTYRLTVYLYNHRCKYSDSTVVKNRPKEIDLLPDSTFRCRNESTQLAPAGLFHAPWRYEWSTGDTTKTISIYEEGSYSVRVSSGNCEYVDHVVVRNLAELWVPNVITPDGDDKNERFVIKNLIKPVGLSIYNRFGKLIYENGQYQNTWSGNSDEDGVFYYVVEDRSGCLDSNVVKGVLSIIR